jgi:chromosome segregation ATPase
MSSANYQNEIIIQLRKEIDRLGHVLRASQSAALENQAEVFRLRAEIERLTAEVEMLKSVEADCSVEANYDDHEREMIDLEDDNARLRAENEKLRAYALKAFTVVEFCSGQGFLLQYPNYDCDDLLMEGVVLLKVETSEEARAALEGKHD